MRIILFSKLRKEYMNLPNRLSPVMYKITLLLFCTQSFAQIRFVVRPDEAGFVMLKCKTDSLQISVMDVSGEANQITILAVPCVLKIDFNQDSLGLWQQVCKNDTTFYNRTAHTPVRKKFLLQLSEIEKGRAPEDASYDRALVVLRFSINPERKSQFADGSTVGAYFDVHTDSIGSIVKIWKKKQ